MAYRINIRDLHEIAAKNGGKCLSVEYVDCFSPLKWMCKRGHTWETSWSHIQQGSWCSQCYKRDKNKDKLNEIKNFAISKGGKCLTTELINLTDKVKWKCKEGHYWTTSPKSILNGTWCKYCAGNARKTMEDMHNLAKKNNGLCLSKEYKNQKSKLTWKCKKGHIWEAEAGSISNGSWCPKCAGKYVYTAEDYQKLAVSHNGKFIGFKTKKHPIEIILECSEGHRWDTKGHYLIGGSWCPICSVKRISLSEIEKLYKPDIETLKDFANLMNGKLLSSYFVDSDSPLKWKCNKGHIWWNSFSEIRLGAWCKECHSIKITESLFAEVRAIARYRQGLCISTKFKSILKFQCKENHQWEADIQTIKLGHWCPYCSGLKLTITDMKAFALTKKGKCLSKKYHNLNDVLLWQCQKGHQWKAPALKVRHQKKWCPICKTINSN